MKRHLLRGLPDTCVVDEMFANINVWLLLELGDPNTALARKLEPRY
jgi:hypothetical protein